MQHLSTLEQQDPAVAGLIASEEQYQQETIRLIASENYVSHAVLEASGSVFTNKYSEGYPGKRYYQGQQYCDAVELLAMARAKELFGAEHVNVQPYSGSPANLEAYYALAAPGDLIMGMSLPHGGHLTHGWKVNFSARFYRAVQYPVDEKTCLLDYAAIAALAREHKPKILVCGASAYPRLLDFARFAEIARSVGAFLVADMAHIAGLVAAGVHPSPVPHADVVTTTTHKSLRGPRGAMILCKEQHAKAIDNAVFPALQGGPHNHTTAAMAVAFGEALTPDFKNYGQRVVANARALADALLHEGFALVTGGTDNHIVLLDLREKGYGGKPLAQALDRAGIIGNYNAVPRDPRKPFDPSGVRLGTCAVSTRGFTTDDMIRLAGWIARVANNLEDEQVIDAVRNEVLELCATKPVPSTFV